MRHLRPALFSLMASVLGATVPFEVDSLKTSSGPLELTFIGHGTLMFQHGGKTIHVDPVASMADYATLPKADLILVTHEHGDHLDPKAIALLRKPTTQIVLSAKCGEKLPGGLVMANGEQRTVQGLSIEAIPAYNLIHMRAPGSPFHPKGEGNGYILTFGTTRVLVAGDTENIPEYKALKGIDVAFLPMNLPYTMTPEMAADAARALMPKILYPYHYGKTDPTRLVELLKDRPEIEVRVRKLQ